MRYVVDLRKTADWLPLMLIGCGREAIRDNSCNLAGRCVTLFYAGRSQRKPESIQTEMKGITA